MRNFSSLAGLEVTEKFELIYFFGWLSGWPGGWVDHMGMRITQCSTKQKVEADLGNVIENK